MATITNPATIHTMLSNGGRYCGDPPPDSIWEYRSTRSGERLFACFYFNQFCDIYQSPFVKDPVLLFADGEVTEAGQAFLAGKEVHNGR